MIHFDFEFYTRRENTDEGRITTNHEDLFRAQLQRKSIATAIAIDDVKRDGIDFDETDFIIYSLFRHQNNYRRGYRDHSEIAESAFHRTNDFMDFFSFSNTVRNTLTQLEGGADRNYSEYQGVAGSLILTNKLFGLTNADYKGIKEDNGKVLDFEYELASTGSNILKIESKGVSGLASNPYEGALSIIEKKEENNANASGRDLYYGVITQIPFRNETGNGKCILVDPPNDDIPIDPLKFKLHSRLNYYRNKVALLSRNRTFYLLDFLMRYIEATKETDWLSTFNKMAEDNAIYPAYYLSPLSFYTTTVVLKVGNKKLKVKAKVDLLFDNKYLFYGLLENLLYELIIPTSERLISINYSELMGEKIKVENISLKYLKGYSTPPANKRVTLSGFVKIFETGEVMGILNSSEEN